MSRSMYDLRVDFRSKAQSVLDACKLRGVTLLVTCTLRSPEDQKSLYEHGRSAAKPGESAHNFGLAMDVVPIVNGKPKFEQESDEFRIFGEESRRAGLAWDGGDHCELSGWFEYI